MSELHAFESFAAHLATVFTLRAPDGQSLALELVEVQRASYADDPAAVAPSGRQEPFTLVFRGPRSPYAQQGTWRLEHDGMGAVDLFIVPIGPDEKGMRYQAILT